MHIFNILFMFLPRLRKRVPSRIGPERMTILALDGVSNSKTGGIEPGMFFNREWITITR